MTRTCYLHVGLPKTGTTSIQGTLSGYSDENIRYARFPNPMHSYILMILFTPDIRAFAPFRDNPKITDLWLSAQRMRLNRLLSADLAEKKDLIFSAEGICGRMKRADFLAMKDRLSGHFDQIKVLAYIRPFMSLAPSMWQQQVKIGLSEFGPVPPNYRRLRTVMDVFGRDNITLVPFTRQALAQGDVVTDFLLRVGIDPSRVTPVRKNDSHSVEALSVIFAHNRFSAPAIPVAHRHEYQKKMFAALQDFGSRKLGFSESLMTAALERSREDVDWISRELEQDMSGRFEPVSEPLESLGEFLALAHEQMPAARAHLAAKGVGPGPRTSGRKSTRLWQRLVRAIRKRIPKPRQAERNRP